MVDAVGSVSSLDQSYVPPPPPAVSRTEAAVARQTVETTRSALIEIVTADGDTVTISASAVRAASVAAAAGQSDTPDGSASVAGGAYSTSSSQSLEITVEGSLEKDEIADIKRLLTILERGARQADRGEHGRGRHRGHDTGRHIEHAALDSLESFTATFKTSTRYAATAAYAAVSSTASPGEAEAPPMVTQAAA